MNRTKSVGAASGRSVVVYLAVLRAEGGLERGEAVGGGPVLVQRRGRRRLLLVREPWPLLVPVPTFTYYHHLNTISAHFATANSIKKETIESNREQQKFSIYGFFFHLHR